MGLSYSFVSVDKISTNIEHVLPSTIAELLVKNIVNIDTCTLVKKYC